jgi:lysophospholipase L1-like esterase
VLQHSHSDMRGRVLTQWDFGSVLTRREFLAVATSAAALGCAGRRAGAPSGSVVVFQGDSITDGGRDRTILEPNNDAAFGASYAALLMRDIRAAHPEVPWRFYNRGISGNKLPDLQARWASDTIALRPDVLSILAGVNDYWHTRSFGYAGTTEDYERQYAALLAATRAALPDVSLVVLEPFVLRTGAVDASWFPTFDERRAAAARVAAAAGARFVPLQSVFDARAAETGPEAWAKDGVHPTPAGHALIAELWRAAVGL